MRAGRGAATAAGQGDRVVDGATLANLSTLALWQGDETRALALARQALDIAVAAQARCEEVLAGLRLGDAELALGRSAAARQAYAQARERTLEIDGAEQHDASVGLARVALADRGAAWASTAAPAMVAAVAADAALHALQPLLDHLAAGGTLDGTDAPRLIELTVHQALARTGDPRAADWLTRANTALMAQADAITDATLRQGFLQNIPHHREIVAPWGQAVARVNRVTGLSVVADRVPLNPLSFAPGLLPSPIGTGGAGSPEEKHG